MLGEFPQRQRWSCPLLLNLSLDRHIWEDEMNVLQKKKRLNVQGHLDPEAKVVYIYASPFLPPVSLFISPEVVYSVFLPNL